HNHSFFLHPCISPSQPLSRGFLRPSSRAAVDGEERESGEVLGGRKRKKRQRVGEEGDDERFADGGGGRSSCVEPSGDG
ncbi:unnamed protein product, partial [Linum tenue]